MLLTFIDAANVANIIYDADISDVNDSRIMIDGVIMIDANAILEWYYNTNDAVIMM